MNRLDKDTSGLLVVAKNDKAHNFLASQLADKTMYRKYYALVSGIIPHDNGTIDAPIGRDPLDRQKMAVTDKNSKEGKIQNDKLKNEENNVNLELLDKLLLIF